MSLETKSKEQLLPPSEAFKKVLSYDEMPAETAAEIQQLAERGNVSIEELARLEQEQAYRMPAFFYGTLLPGNVAENLVGGGVDGAIKGELLNHSVIAIERDNGTRYEHFPAAYKDPESNAQIVKGFVFTFKEKGPMQGHDQEVGYAERLAAICDYEEVSPDGVKPGLYTLDIANIRVKDDFGNEKTVPAIYFHATTELLEHRTQTDAEDNIDRYEDNIPIGLGDIATRTTVSDWTEYLDRIQKS